jgi:hypothetical protein
MVDGPLTPEQVETFHHDGFLVARGMYGAAEMQQIARWTDEIGAWPETPGRHMMYFEESQRDGSRILNRMENFYPYHQGFRELFDAAKMRASVGQLFGEPAVLFKDKVNFKKAGGDGFKPHQDVQAGWNRYGTLHISVLLSIDESTIENGCLELVKGFHDRGVVGNMWAPLTDEMMAGMKFEAYPTRPGDVVFFDSFAPHGSGPNRTDAQRRILYVTYGKASDGDQREQYYADKRKSFPQDCEREAGKQYVFRV